MKQNQRKKCRIFMLLTLVLGLAAVFQLQARIRLESHDKAIAVVMLQDDIQQLSENDGSSIERWYQTLADSGLSAVIVPSEQLEHPEVTDPIMNAGMQIVQMGGEGRPGLYFAPLEYDIQFSKDAAFSAEIAPPSTGRVWTMVENNPQTGCVLPQGYAVTNSDGPWVKGFYLRQNERARTVTTELGDVQEVGDMLFRAVADRGVQVLWIAPLGDEDGLDTDLQTYESLLSRLQMRIERCGFHYGIPQGIEPLVLPPFVLVLCGFGIFAAALLLLCLLFRISDRVAWVLYLVCALECVAGAILRPQLQEILLALGASIVFPALSIFYLGAMLQNAKNQQLASWKDYFCTLLIGSLIIYSGAAGLPRGQAQPGCRISLCDRPAWLDAAGVPKRQTPEFVAAFH